MHILPKQISKSLWVIFILFALLVVFRTNSIDKKEISWDVFGYYLPLVATFQQDDALLNDRSWVEKLNNEKQLSGTVYQISSNDEGKPMYFFLFGMSYFYAVFYFIGDLIAGWTGYATDGFSLPYQLSLVYGCMIYTLIGLLYFRKILREFFSENITAIALLLVVLGTNYAHHMSLKNLETVNVLFMLATILIWNTIQWHKTFQFKNLIWIGLSVALMALVKPSEILFLLLPMLWNVTNKETFKGKLKRISAHKVQFLVVILCCFLLAFPQLYYWHLKTGSWIYDTYKNPGVGLDIFSPHIYNSLFSYRKGWLVYTPLMFFALTGFYFVYKNNKKIFPAVAISLFVSSYIVFSWTEWWYGAGFSNRPMLTYYPLLAIGLGYFLKELLKWNRVIQFSIGFCMLFFVFLNQFQWWQLQNYILDPYRTTKAYYWATFLKTEVTPEQQKLLLVNRDFTGNNLFTEKQKYTGKTLVNDLFSKFKGGIFYSPSEEEFGYSHKFPFSELTKKDHAWIELRFDYKCPSTEQPILVAFCMDRKNGAYGYTTFELEQDSLNWKSKTIHFLTPEIRSKNDMLKIDFWKRSPANLWIDNLKIVVYEKK